MIKNNKVLIRSNLIAAILLLILSVAVNYTGLAQSHADSTEWVDENDSVEVYYYNGSILNLKLDSLSYIDTIITQTHQYDWLYHGNKSYATLSNIGFAHTNLSFSPMLSPGYSSTLPYYRQYIYTSQKVRFYKLNKPYTELFYTMGPKKEQEFNVVFSRELYKGLSFGLNFYLVSSHGEYKRSKSNNNIGYLTLGYITPNKRYNVNACYLFNKLDMQENGGIKSDNYFSDNLETDRSVIPINLDNANNIVAESDVFVEQFFNLSKPRKETDTTGYFDFGSISYAVHYKKNYYLYTDKDPLAPFYDTLLIPMDSIQTNDSTGQQIFTNSIGWTSVGYQENINQKPFYIYGNLTHDNITQQLPYDSIKTSWNQLNVSGGFGVNIKESFYLKGSGYLYFGGYNSGDFEIKGSINQYLGNKNRNFGELVFSTELISKMPWWFYQNYNSNHFRWNNDFNKETFLIISGDYSFKHLNLGASFTTIGNYTYLDNKLKPAQLNHAETVLKLFLQGNIPILKFGVNARLEYQATSQPNIIRMPTFHGSMNIYFKSPVFKKAATLQTGFQLRYFTAYYANAYMPELRAFYLQDEKEIGNYLWADVYITLKVQRARLFVKMSNFTSYFEGYDYWLTPHYPDRDARFYFGVSWRFHD